MPSAVLVPETPTRTSSVPPPKPAPAVRVTKKPTPPVTTNQSSQSTKPAAPPKNPPSKPAQAGAAPAVTVNKASVKEESPKAETKPPPKADPKATETTKKKRPEPPKGKARVVCGCFGSLHKALTNCMYCGRISCAKEGYSFCPFCEYKIENEDRRHLYVLLNYRSAAHVLCVWMYVGVSYVGWWVLSLL